MCMSPGAHLLQLRPSDPGTGLRMPLWKQLTCPILCSWEKIHSWKTFSISGSVGSISHSEAWEHFTQQSVILPFDITARKKTLITALSFQHSGDNLLNLNLPSPFNVPKPKCWTG